MTHIAFIGVGHMGAPMVHNLLKAKYSVSVFDISKEAVDSVVADGARAPGSIAQAVKDADYVFTMLQTGEQVKSCCLSDDGVFAHINSTAIYVDSSSIDIQSSRELHDIAASKNIAMLDAPVSGGVGAAAGGTLTFMAGGDNAAFERVKAVLAVMGKNIIYAGGAGNGVVAKICNNMILGVSMIAVSEAFVLADKLGLEAKKLFDICATASGQCWALTSYCPAPEIMPNVPSSHDYEAGFMAKMMLKYLKLSQDAAKKASADTQLGKHAMDLYSTYVEQGNGEIDFSGIIQMISEVKYKG